MKRLGIFVLLTSLAGGVFAQDLDTTVINDQFNVGERGQNRGSLTFGGAARDGSEFVDYNGTDATATPTTAIRYINSWGTNASVIESPIVNVTSAMNNRDRGLTGNIPAIPANTRPGATDGSTAVQIGDDGGFNALFFGDMDDKNYYVEVDVWCPGLSAGASFNPGQPFEVAGVTARAGRDNMNAQYLGQVSYTTLYGEHSYSPDRAPGYGLYYDYQKQEVSAVRWKLSNTIRSSQNPNGEIDNRNTSAALQLGTLPNVPQGWHTMRIECLDETVTFKFNGVTVATVNDSVTFVHPTDPTQTTFDYGRPCLYYRENFVADANEKQALFDNLRAGPTVGSSVNDWSMY